MNLLVKLPPKNTNLQLVSKLHKMNLLLDIKSYMYSQMKQLIS